MPDGRKRTEDTYQTAGCDCAGTDVEDVRISNRRRRHVLDECSALRGKRHAQELSEVADHRDEHEVREHTAGAHDRSYARANDVADSKELGRNLSGDGRISERHSKYFLRIFLPRLEGCHCSLVDESDSEAGEDRLRARASTKLFLLSLCFG